MPEDQDSTLTQAISAGLPPQFEERGLIGQGGMGLVIRAFDKYLEREVAVKLLLGDSCRNDELKQRFEREAKALASLNHINIVKLLNWGVSDNGSPFHVLELLNGEPLSQMLNRTGRLSELQFQQIFSQLMAGLAHAHEHKIVHRDLKPSNIMICHDTDGTTIVKIIDFGIARFTDEDDGNNNTLTMPNTVLGSPSYMSPEQCKGIRADHLSDIYSLGCVMYIAITGKLPFAAESSMDVMYKHITADWVHLESIVIQNEFRDLALLIDSCLAKEPSARPQSVAEILPVFNRCFSSLADSRKLIRLKGDRQSLPLPLAAMLMIILAALSLVSIASMRSKTRNDKASARSTAELIISQKADREAKAERETKAERNAEKHLGLIEETFKQEKDPERRRALALNLIVIARNRSQQQRDRNEFAESEKSMRRILPLSQAMDDPAIVQSVTLGDIAKLRIDQKDYRGAVSICKEALEILRNSGNGDGDNSTGVLRIRAEALIRAHDFILAGKDFEHMTRIWSMSGQGSGPLSSAASTNRAGMIFGLLHAVQTQSFVDNRERLAALQLINELSKYLLPRCQISEQATLISDAEKLLKEIPVETAGYAPVASAAYKNLSSCAEQEGKLQEMKRFKKLSEDFAGQKQIN